MLASLGVVVPAYRPDVASLARYVGELADRLDPEVVRIELDAPRAGVADALRRSLHAAPVEVNAVHRRRGKGAAVTAGFEALDTEILAFVDADGSTPPEWLDEIVRRVREREADLAVGSRRHPESVVRSHQTIVRRYAGDAFARLARRIVGVDVYDYQCGAKAVAAETWADVRGHVDESGFAWDVELVAVVAALDRRIVEVPIAWEDRPGSTVSPVRDGVDMLRGLLRARHRGKLVRGNRLHGLLDRPRETRPALAERIGGATGSGAEVGDTDPETDGGEIDGGEIDRGETDATGTAAERDADGTE